MSDCVPRGRRVNLPSACRGGGRGTSRARGAGEIPYAYWPAKAGAGFYRARDDFDPIREAKILEVPSADFDIFGDGSLVVFRTPGHTPGELSLLVRLPSRNFVLVGDSVHIR